MSESMNQDINQQDTTPEKVKTAPASKPPKMSLTNTLLLLVALAQAALVGYMFWNQTKTTTVSTAPLIEESITIDDISTISLSDADGKTVNLAQKEGAWILPDAGDFPVTESNVTSLVSKLQDIDSRTAIASSKASYKRLQVADDDFIRKVDLGFSDGKTQSLYLGSSPSASSIHVRSSNNDSVFLSNDINSFDVRTNSGNWVDTSYLNLSSDEVTEVVLKNAQGEFNFTRAEDDTWQLAGLGAEDELDTAAVDSLINKVSSVRMLRPLGKVAEDNYNVGLPQAELTITTETEIVIEAPEEDSASSEQAGTSLLDAEASTDTSEGEANSSPAPEPEPEVEIERNSYKLMIAANLDDGFVAKREGSEYYVLLSAFSAEDFVTKAQEDFIVQEEAEATE